MTTATIERLNAEAQRQVLEGFAGTLKRESHNLLHQPNLLWQQLYNRLQWEDKPVPQLLAPELARRSAPGGAPWLKTKTPFRESKALIRTLAGHTSTVDTCAVSPDGSFVVSGSGDCTLKIWDAKTGKERATISLLGNLHCVALHSQRPLAACGDYGGNVYFLNLIGFDYKPFIVTAVNLGNGHEVRCPACLTYLPLKKDWLGQEIACREPGCDGRMRVNPFVIGSPPSSDLKSVAASKPAVSDPSVLIS